MLKGYNNSHIKSNFCANNEGQYFFIQKWVELTSNYSLFTYQIRFKNARNLLIEIIDVIKLLENSDMNISNLTSVIEEASTVLKKDICLEKHRKQMYYALMTGLDKFNIKDKDNEKKGNNSSLIRIKAQISVFLKTVKRDTYYEWLMDDLKESIDNSEYKNIDLYSELLASELINDEWTSGGLYSTFKQSFSDKSNYNFDSGWENFRNTLIGKKEKFIFFFKSNYSNSDEIFFLPENISMISGDEICNEFSKAENHISKEDTYIKFEREHYDYRYVQQEAYYIIKKINAIYSFYEEGFKIICDDKCIIVFENSNVLPFEGVEKIQKKIDFYKLNQEIKNLNFILTENDGVDEISRKRFTDALMQYRNSIESIAPDKKYLSLWSSMETLLNTGQYPSIIEHIKKIVPAVMCSRYAYKILKNLLNDFYRCNIEIEFKKRKLNTETPEYIDVDSILEMIKDTDQFKHLIELCQDNELMKYRLDSLKDNFSSNGNLYTFLINNYNNVFWNVQRLYRYRNQIVHYSDVLGNITILCSHLNYYIRTIVSEINYRFQDESVKFNSLVEVYSYLYDNYFVLKSFLEPTKSQGRNEMPYSNDFILRNAIEH